ncbi:Predicted ATPase [Lutibacter agarilyticus]|uniref:Predicted ATPase n=1 Tax=Lutibacter agarilyticus TaxID=1109740 RepID=A0A238WYY7_9FLAO|nr:AAA family ATPase [Lutibacter agarilyticus]SNR51672.1 Predicted ATPase [Lutibacter agarilyticus]
MAEIKKKYIISGAPGSGKSTLINALEEKGIQCLNEVSRDIIIAEQNSGNNGMPWGNMERFARLVFDETLIRFKKQPESLFCDRSLIDTMAYLEFADKPIFEDLKNFDFNQYYHPVVFFALPWSHIYIKDPQRPESFEYQWSLSNKLIAYYKNHNFKIVYLPFTSVQLRVDFIINNLKDIYC